MELFATPEYRCDPEATWMSGFLPDKAEKGQLDPALPAWLGICKTLLLPRAARPTQPATEVCQQSTGISNSKTDWFCILRQYLLFCSYTNHSGVYHGPREAQAPQLDKKAQGRGQGEAQSPLHSSSTTPETSRSRAKGSSRERPSKGTLSSFSSTASKASV